jgi:N-acetylglucosamine-6-phosphate deacetylase
MPRVWLRNAELVDPERARPQPGALLIEDGRIAARSEGAGPPPSGAAAELDLRGARLAPGFLDVHFHGRAIFAPPGELSSAVANDAAELVRHGVTGFLVTTVAWPQPQLLDFVRHAARAVRAPAADLAVPLGLHLEGPWISPGAAGAQPASGIRPFAPADLDRLLDSGEGSIRMLTFAPEIDGATLLAERLRQERVIAALGHSMTRASDAEGVIERGARHVTHLFNAMSGLHHRELGLAGVALTDERLTSDLICDGAHVAAPVVRLAARVLGERLVLASDRVDPPPGADFGSGALHDDGVALRLRDGRLAGSRLTLDRAAANLQRLAGASLCEAVAAASLRPARLLGLEAERGTLRPGARADLVVLESDGSVRETWIGGRRVWARAGA